MYNVTLYRMFHISNHGEKGLSSEILILEKSMASRVLNGMSQIFNGLLPVSDSSAK